MKSYRIIIIAAYLIFCCAGLPAQKREISSGQAYVQQSAAKQLVAQQSDIQQADGQQSVSQQTGIRQAYTKQPGAPQTDAQQSAAMRAVIVDKQTGEPILGASVDLYSVLTPEIRDKHSLSAANGAINIGSIPYGRYYVTISSIGSQQVEKELNVDSAEIDLGTIEMEELLRPDKLYSNKLQGSVGFDYSFDNREYSGMEFGRSETIFGARLLPEVGWSSSSQGSRHQVMAGVSLTADFGSNRIDSYRPVLYYRYSLDDLRRHNSVYVIGNRFDMYAGIFSRTVMRAEYSGAFFSDKYLFYNNLLQGLFLYYEGVGGSYIEAALDWHSRREGSRREKFMLISSGGLKLFDSYSKRGGRIFPRHQSPSRQNYLSRNYGSSRHTIYAGYNFTMHHHAASDEVSGVMDNMLFYPHAAWSWHAFNFELDIRAGWLQSFQRDRTGIGGFVMPGGFHGEAGFKMWSGFGIKESIYLGEGLMTYYDAADSAGIPYGEGLYFGDPFYRTGSGVYNRLELFWERNFGAGVNIKVSSIHHYDGSRWGWQQMLSISANIDNL